MFRSFHYGLNQSKKIKDGKTLKHERIITIWLLWITVLLTILASCTPSQVATYTVTNTLTVTPTPLPSVTQTVTVTPPAITRTVTSTAIIESTPTPSVTPTATPSVTPVATLTYTNAKTYIVKRTFSIINGNAAINTIRVWLPAIAV